MNYSTNVLWLDDVDCTVRCNIGWLYSVLGGVDIKGQCWLVLYQKENVDGC